MKYIVTWRPSFGEMTYLTIFEGSAGMPILQIMSRVHEIEEIEDEFDDFELYSIVRADNVEVIY